MATNASYCDEMGHSFDVWSLGMWSKAVAVSVVRVNGHFYQPPNPHSKAACTSDQLIMGVLCKRWHDGRWSEAPVASGGGMNENIHVPPTHTHTQGCLHPGSHSNGSLFASGTHWNVMLGGGGLRSSRKRFCPFLPPQRTLALHNISQ